MCAPETTARPSLARAVAISLLGIFLLDAMGAVIKHLGDAYPPQQLAAFRNLFGLVPTLFFLLTAREWHEQGRPVLIAQWRIAISRGLFVTFAQFCFYTSLVHLEFATASTLAFAGPMFVTALSVPLLRERVGPWRWSAVAMGFTGIVLVMKPGSDVFTPYALLPLGAALGYALSAVTVRLVAGSVPSPMLNAYAHASAFLGATALTLATTGYVPIASAVEWTWIVVMGLCGGTGVLCLVVAYRMTRPSNLAPFDYVGILFAFALGYLFFGEAPFDRLFPGIFLIAGGGFVIIWRDRRPEGAPDRGREQPRR